MTDDPKGPPWFVAELNGENIGSGDPLDTNEDHTLRFSNPDAENGGDETRGPLEWVNSARVTLDPEEDAVHFVCSIFDPRGGFGFTVRRMRGSGKGDADDNAGILLLHYPYPGAGMQHAEVREVGPGTVEVIGQANLPKLPDSVALLRDILKIPGVRDCLRSHNARERSEKVPTYRRILSRVRDWLKACDEHDAATPCRVAVHDDEETDDGGEEE